MNQAWWEKGVKFECQGSGKCCVSRGEYGYVYLTLEDRQNLAKHFKLSTREFSKKYCKKEDDLWVLKDFTKSCVFLEGKSCAVYAARPMQCRTWPFWPELMNARAWNKEVKGYCPGVGKGKVWEKAEIEKNIKLQLRSEKLRDIGR
jgi:Fe-S-cluster containining protein